MARVAIVGAGISGLATAHYLGRQAEVVIFEKEAAPGGTMRSQREQGFVMERGPNGFLTNKPHALELAAELGCAGRLLPASDFARKRFVFSGGALHRLPESPAQFLRSRLLSVRGRLRVMAEPFAAPPPGLDESLAAFACRRLGREAMEKLIEPMAAGVFAGDPDELSLASCFPRIHELEARYGGLIRAMLTLRRERRKAGRRERMSAGPGGALTSFDTGVEVLVEILAGRCGGDLRLGCAVESVSRSAGKYRLAVRSAEGLAECEADAVVLAAPAFAAGGMLRGLDGGLAAELERIPYAPIAVAALGYEAAALGRPLDGFGFLVPRLEGRRILGALWDSSVFAGRAPEGKALLRVMVGGARQPQLARLGEKELAALVKEELRVCMGISAEPVLTRVFSYEKGIPQYLVGHGRLLESVAARLSGLPGLYLNSNAYRGVSLNDCVRESKATAVQAAQVRRDR